jgi:hypothetical protein
MTTGRKAWAANGGRQGEPSDLPYNEDLPRLAAESFALSERWCRSCGRMHALWPYIRLARASTGVEAGASHLQCLMAALIADGRRSVLIAGAADTGLLALVARASAGRDPRIVVLDRCGTPLELCRRQAQRWSIPVDTMLTDLRKLEVGGPGSQSGPFDLVLVHGTLHFIAAQHRVDVLVRLRRSLGSEGRLLLLFNASRPIDDALRSESRGEYADWVIDELERIAVPLPEPREEFRARLHRHAEQREDREGVFAAPEDVEALLAGAGFTLRERFEIAARVTTPVESFLAKIGKRRFLMVAEPDLRR